MRFPSLIKTITMEMSFIFTIYWSLVTKFFESSVPSPSEKLMNSHEQNRSQNLHSIIFSSLKISDRDFEVPVSKMLTSRAGDKTRPPAQPRSRSKQVIENHYRYFMSFENFVTTAQSKIGSQIDALPPTLDWGRSGGRHQIDNYFRARRHFHGRSSYRNFSNIFQWWIISCQPHFWLKTRKRMK